MVRFSWVACASGSRRRVSFLQSLLDEQKVSRAAMRVKNVLFLWMAAMLLAAMPSLAAPPYDVTWTNGSGNYAWDLTSQNWTGGNDSLYTDGDNPTIAVSSSGTYTITVAGGINPGVTTIANTATKSSRYLVIAGSGLGGTTAGQLVIPNTNTSDIRFSNIATTANNFSSISIAGSMNSVVEVGTNPGGTYTDPLGTGPITFAGYAMYNGFSVTTYFTTEETGNPTNNLTFHNAINVGSNLGQTYIQAALMPWGNGSVMSFNGNIANAGNLQFGNYGSGGYTTTNLGGTNSASTGTFFVQLAKSNPAANYLYFTSADAGSADRHLGLERYYRFRVQHHFHGLERRRRHSHDPIGRLGRHQWLWPH